jgi:hypothetical protein
MRAILIGPLSAARAGGAATDEDKSASAIAAGRTREGRIKIYLKAGERNCAEVMPSTQLSFAAAARGTARD